MLTILIVDDEVPAREKLKRFLGETDPSAKLLEADNGQEAVRTMTNTHVDLLFLDIQMPRMTGMDVARTMGAENLPATIFVTAFDAFAVEAFELEAVDYLLKPFDRNRFDQAFRRAQNRIQKAEGLEDAIRRVLQSSAGNRPLDRIMVQHGKGMVLIRASEIFSLTKEEKYVAIQTEKKTFFLRSSLTALLERLNQPRLIRIHKSSAINIDFVERIESLFHGDMMVMMKNGQKLTCSRRYRKELPIV